MLKLSDQVGQQQDWANLVTNVAMVDTPFLAWLPVGSGLVATEWLYQAETYRDPEQNSHPDGLPVTNDKSAGENRKELRSTIQYATKKASVSVLAQNFGNVAGVSDELATEIRKQTKELSKDLECSFLSPQECRLNVTGTTGALTRGVPNWIQCSAQGVYPVDSTLYPAAAQVDATATASLTEDVVLNILQGICTTTRGKDTITAFIGPNAQRAFNNFPMFVPSTASTVNAGAYPSPVRGGAFDRGIQRYVSPFGPVDLVLSLNNYAFDSSGTFGGGAATLSSHGCFFLHQPMWKMRWGTMNGGSGQPKWLENEYAGGKRSAFCETVVMLACMNPKGEAKYAPAT